jgi:hypothetical protein
MRGKTIPVATLAQTYSMGMSQRRIGQVLDEEQNPANIIADCHLSAASGLIHFAA